MNKDFEESHARICETLIGISGSVGDLIDVIDRHENHRKTATMTRGYEQGHVADWYERKYCKAVIQRRIREIRKSLLDLSKMFDKEPGVWE